MKFAFFGRASVDIRPLPCMGREALRCRPMGPGPQNDQNICLTGGIFLEYAYLFDGIMAF